jgi:hypothetical protein
LRQTLKLAKLINDDPNQDLFTESERWHMAALGVDLVSSLAGVTGKVITGATGTGFMAGGCQVATSITCSRIRYECTVIYWTMTSAGDVEKCGYTRRA